MKLKDLYSKPINRAVNPAVSATKFDPETERIEIQEYVFTDEIINGLFRILDAIKNNKPYDHVGIWIDGYYGSGKSHFLKYLDYCITPSTREDAVSRLLDAVKAIDPLDEKHNLNFDYDELLSIANWLKRATIDTCIFNLETSYDNSTDKKKAFLHVFWNEFNGKRGFNKFNITLAQNLEKPLAEKGVFEAFKERIAEVVNGVAATYRTPATIETLSDVPPLVLDDGMTKASLGYVGAVLPKAAFLPLFHAMASEDFALISSEIPSAYFTVGAAVADTDEHFAQHHPKARFNDAELPLGAAAYAAVALGYIADHR